MTEHQIPDDLWPLIQHHLGYTDEEMAMFRRDPRNHRVLAAAGSMREKTIVFEVVESRGCNSRHIAGTRFFFTGDGNLITRMAPSRVCAFAMPVMTQAIFGIQELWYAGVDPNRLSFRRGGCFDVGVRCGGWGHIILEASVVDRAEAERLHREG
jgi:hypothetical protein